MNSLSKVRNGLNFCIEMKLSEKQLKLFKIIFICVNIILLGLGISFIYYGGIHGNNLNKKEMADNPSRYLLITFGSFIFAFVIVGILGAILEVRWVLSAYICLMSLACLTIIPLTFWLLESEYGISDEMPYKIKADMIESMIHFNRTSNWDKWDNWQEKGKCCGVDSYEDWFKYGPYSNAVPVSCCSSEIQCNMSNPESFYKSGCYEHVVALGEHLRNIISVGVIAGLMFLVILTGIILAAIPMLATVEPELYSESSTSSSSSTN